MEKSRNVGAVATKEDQELFQKVQQSGKPPDLEPAGECHYCHRRKLERRRAGMLVFYACTNEEGCCLMFWRRPRGVCALPDEDEFSH